MFRLLFIIRFNLQKQMPDTLSRRKHYTVEIYLGGNVAGGGGAGSLDPEKPIVHSNMTYVITSAKWFPVTVSKSFH